MATKENMAELNDILDTDTAAPTNSLMPAGKNTTDSSAMETVEALTTDAEKAAEPGVGCVLKKVLDVIGGKWKIRIICNIGKEKVLRYNELKRIVDGITNTMLSNSLKELEADGFVVRTQYPEMPVRVEYTLADKGESIMPILLELEAWGKENLVLEA